MKKLCARFWCDFHWAFILVFLVGASGCYHYRVMDKDSSPNFDYRHERLDSFFWGLIQENKRCMECGEEGKTRGLDEVRISTNFGYQLIGVFSLGIWVPVDVEWRCKPVAPPVGDI